MEEKQTGLMLTGKVLQVLPLQGGTSAATGKKWAVQTFIVETQENYPRKVAIEIFGEQRIKDNYMSVGGIYDIDFDLESREFNGNWYTSARAWRTTLVAGDPEPQAVQVVEAEEVNSLGESEDLPF